MFFVQFKEMSHSLSHQFIRSVITSLPIGRPLKKMSHPLKSNPRRYLNRPYIDEYWQNGGWHLTGGQPQGRHLSQTLPVMLGEALQVDQDLLHFLLVHLLQVFIPKRKVTRQQRECVSLSHDMETCHIQVCRRTNHGRSIKKGSSLAREISTIIIGCPTFW